MGVAAVQNYVISQGSTLESQLFVQLPGIPYPDTATTTIGSTAISGLNGTYTPGMSISGPGIQPNTILNSFSNGNGVLSQPALASGALVAVVIGAFVPIDLTSVSLLFSMKTASASNNGPLTASQQQAAACSLPDSDSISQGVYEFDWTETSTPTLGQTTLVLPDTITQQMVAGNWYYLIRAVGASTIPASTDIVTGVIAITQPVSFRLT